MSTQADKQSAAEGAERLEPWLNVEQAAEYLGFTDRANRRWCRQGVLRHTLSPGGKNYRFRREWLDELLYAREQEPAIRRTVVERRARRRPEPVASTFAERNPILATALAKANARTATKSTASTKRGR